MNRSYLAPVLAVILSLPAASFGEAEISAESLFQSSAEVGPVSLEAASYTLAEAGDPWMILFVDTDVLLAMLSSAGGLGLTGTVLSALGQAEAHRRFRDAASEGITRLTAREATPISNSAANSSLRQVAQLEEVVLRERFPHQDFSEPQLTALIIAQSRRLEATPE